MKLLRFTADARAEFLAEVAYYNEAAAGLGERFEEEHPGAEAAAGHRKGMDQFRLKAGGPF